MTVSTQRSPSAQNAAESYDWRMLEKSFARSKSVPFATITSAGRINVGHQLRELWQYRELLMNFAWREISTRYRNTALGIAWAVAQPTALMVVASASFALIFPHHKSGAPYALLVYTALLPWQYFSTAVGRASNSVLSVGGLIKKVYFPRLLAPVSAVIPPLVDMFIGFTLLLFMLPLFHYKIDWHVLFAPLFVLLSAATALGVGIWTSALSAKYKDMHHVVPLALQLGFFATPILYSPDNVPELVRKLYMINPMFTAIAGFRWSVAGGEPVGTTALVLSVAIASVLLVTGSIYFMIAEEYFADYL